MKTFSSDSDAVRILSRRTMLQQGTAALPIIMSGISSGAHGASPRPSGRASVSVSSFGQLEDGQPVRLARLEQPGGIVAEICEFGGIVKSIALDGSTPSLVLGFDTLDEYVADQRYVCGIVGRVANRIAGGRFTLDDREYVVSQNRDGDCLHGGFRGFNKRLWRIVGTSENPAPTVHLAYRSEDMEEGFPGQLDVTATFSLPSPKRLQIDFEASTSRATPVNLSHHFYFNLGAPDEDTILEHELKISASHFTPITMGAIPTGEIRPVDATPFDFRTARRLADILAAEDPQIEAGRGLNHNWVLDAGQGPALLLRSPRSGVSMTIETDQPGMQINSGHRLGAPFPAYGGLIIEPQHFPDSVNQPHFPDTILRPGDLYRSTYALEFDRSA